MRTPRPWLLPNRPTSGTSLRAAGITEAMLATAVAGGSLLRLRPNVYLATASWPDEPVARHVMASRAEQVMHPTAVISHASAASIWGLPHPEFGDWADDGVHLSRVGGSRPERPGVVHHLVQLPPGQVTTDADGWPVTTAARTAVDLAGDRPMPEALVLLDAAARQACQGFVSTIRRSDYRNPKLVGAARSLLEEAAATARNRRIVPVIGLADPCRESPIESLSAGYFEAAGLPRPLCQEPVRTRAGTFYPDFLWPDIPLVGEADGAGKYADGRAWVSEREREQILRDAGYRVVRWLGRELRSDPWVVVRRVARELGLL